MATDITRRAGKGLQRQLMTSTPHYRAEHDRIFGKKPVEQAGWEEKPDGWEDAEPPLVKEWPAQVSG